MVPQSTAHRICEMRLLTLCLLLPTNLPQLLREPPGAPPQR